MKLHAIPSFLRSKNIKPMAFFSAILVGLIIATIGAPNSAYGQAILKNRIGPWDVMCETPTGSKAEICALVQKQQNTERQNARIGMTIGRLVDDGTFFMRITTPLGVFLPKKLSLKIDNAAIGETPFIKCWPGGCMSETPLTSDFLQQFLSGSEATFTFFLSPDVSISFALSLDQMKEALNELK